MATNSLAWRLTSSWKSRNRFDHKGTADNFGIGSRTGDRGASSTQERRECSRSPFCGKSHTEIFPGFDIRIEGSTTANGTLTSGEAEGDWEELRAVSSFLEVDIKAVYYTQSKCGRKFYDHRHLQGFVFPSCRASFFLSAGLRASSLPGFVFPLCRTSFFLSAGLRFSSLQGFIFSLL